MVVFITIKLYKKTSYNLIIMFSQSELFANIARGAVNNIYKGEYILSENWEKLEYDDIEKDIIVEQKNLEKMDSKMNYDYIAEEKVIKTEGVYMFNIGDSHWAKDFYLKIYHNNINESIFDHIKDWTVTMNIGGQKIFSFNIITHILMAELKGKKIVYDEDFIKIPLIFIDLFGERKLPTIAFPYHRADVTVAKTGNKTVSLKCKMELVFSDIRCLDIDKQSQKIEKLCNYSKEYLVMQKNITYSKLYTISPENMIKFNGLGKLLFIRFIPKNKDIVVEPSLTEIHLSFNGLNPMIYRDNDLIRLTVLGETFYCISFFPNIKSKSALKKIFRHKLKSNTDNAKVHFSGINFSRIDTTKITFIMDPDINNYDVEFNLITSNILHVTCGMAGVRYSQ